jgi:hypothetical protein
VAGVLCVAIGTTALKGCDVRDEADVTAAAPGPARTFHPRNHWSYAMTQCAVTLHLRYGDGASSATVLAFFEDAAACVAVNGTTVPICHNHADAADVNLRLGDSDPYVSYAGSRALQTAGIVLLAVGGSFWLIVGIACVGSAVIASRASPPPSCHVVPDGVPPLGQRQ